VQSDIVLRIITKLILPFVILFALYTFFHGTLGAGGAFQGGVIIAAGIILYGLIFGLDAAYRIAPPRIVEAMMPLGVAVYAGTGIAAILMGGNFLEYNALAASPTAGQSLGVLGIEIGVVTTVSSVMLQFYYSFAARARE
jgi:multicomponent Na+:H+ antiporter subunit B